MEIATDDFVIVMARRPQSQSFSSEQQQQQQDVNTDVVTASMEAWIDSLALRDEHEITMDLDTVESLDCETGLANHLPAVPAVRQREDMEPVSMFHFPTTASLGDGEGASVASEPAGVSKQSQPGTVRVIVESDDGENCRPTTQEEEGGSGKSHNKHQDVVKHNANLLGLQTPLAVSCGLTEVPTQPTSNNGSGRAQTLVAGAESWRHSPANAHLAAHVNSPLPARTRASASNITSTSASVHNSSRDGWLVVQTGGISSASSSSIAMATTGDSWAVPYPSPPVPPTNGSSPQRQNLSLSVDALNVAATAARSDCNVTQTATATGLQSRPAPASRPTSIDLTSAAAGRVNRTSYFQQQQQRSELSLNVDALPSAHGSRQMLSPPPAYSSPLHERWRRQPPFPWSLDNCRGSGGARARSCLPLVSEGCCSRARCRRCITQMTTFRCILGSLVMVGVGCIIAGVSLGVLHVTSSSTGYITLSVLFTGLGIMMIAVVGIGWRCTPSEHEPCHLLFNLGHYTVTPVTPGRLSDDNRHRSANTERYVWFTEELFPEFRTRRPPPPYSEAVGMSQAAGQPTSSSATARHHCQSAVQTMPACQGQGSSRATPSSPPPLYRSRTSTLQTPRRVPVPGGGCYPYTAHYASSVPVSTVADVHSSAPRPVANHRSYLSTRLRGECTSPCPGRARRINAAGYDNSAVTVDAGDEERAVAAAANRQELRSRSPDENGLDLNALHLAALNDDSMTRAELVVLYLQSMLQGEGRIDENPEDGEDEQEEETGYRNPVNVSTDTGISLGDNAAMDTQSQCYGDWETRNMGSNVSRANVANKDVHRISHHAGLVQNAL